MLFTVYWPFLEYSYDVNNWATMYCMSLFLMLNIILSNNTGPNNLMKRETSVRCKFLFFLSLNIKSQPGGNHNTFFYQATVDQKSNLKIWMGAVIDKRLLYRDITEYFIFVCHDWRYLTKYCEPWFTNRRLFF